MTINRNLSIFAEGTNSTGIVVPANGGTGLSSPGASGNVLTSNGTVWVSSAPSGGGVSSFNTRTGAVTLQSSDVTTALGYTPYNPGVNTVLTNANFNTYAPTLTGTGASGTWGISITGNEIGRAHV